MRREVTPLCAHTVKEQIAVLYTDPLQIRYKCSICGEEWIEEDPESRADLKRRLGATWWVS